VLISYHALPKLSYTVCRFPLSVLTNLRWLLVKYPSSLLESCVPFKFAVKIASDVLKTTGVSFNVG
jgi:hypothetical protein